MGRRLKAKLKTFGEYALVFIAIVFVPFTVAGLPILLVMYHPEIAQLSFELGLVWLCGVAILMVAALIVEGFKK